MVTHKQHKQSAPRHSAARVRIQSRPCAHVFRCVLLLLLCVCVFRYYIDKSGAQKGPCLAAALKADWRSSQVDAECIAWNGALDNWV